MQTRTVFHKKLRDLQAEVVIMGRMVCNAIQLSVEALKCRDLDLARQIVEDDQKINDKRFEIEDHCIGLMATQQPLASDLRIMVAVLNIISELERIGDYAAGISQIAILMGDEPPLKPLIDIPRMAHMAVDMLQRSLDAFIILDAEAAREVCQEDVMVDQLLNQINRELLVFMMEDPKTITRATRLIWVAQNLERSADRATNIAERVVFVITGKMEEIEAAQY